METVSLEVAGIAATFELDFDDDTWHSDAKLPEGEFPIVAEISGKRYELFSDGTFGEEELP